MELKQQLLEIGNVCKAVFTRLGYKRSKLIVKYRGENVDWLFYKLSDDGKFYLIVGVKASLWGRGSRPEFNVDKVGLQLEPAAEFVQLANSNLIPYLGSSIDKRPLANCSFQIAQEKLQHYIDNMPRLYLDLGEIPTEQQVQDLYDFMLTKSCPGFFENFRYPYPFDSVDIDLLWRWYRKEGEPDFLRRVTTFAYPMSLCMQLICETDNKPEEAESYRRFADYFEAELSKITSGEFTGRNQLLKPIQSDTLNR